jgi:hypothetical protein
MMLAENFSERCKEKKKRRKFDGRWEEEEKMIGGWKKRSPKSWVKNLQPHYRVWLPIMRPPWSTRAHALCASGLH